MIFWEKDGRLVKLSSVDFVSPVCRSGAGGCCGKHLEIIIERDDVLDYLVLLTGSISL